MAGTQSGRDSLSTWQRETDRPREEHLPPSRGLKASAASSPERLTSACLGGVSISSPGPCWEVSSRFPTRRALCAPGPRWHSAAAFVFGDTGTSVRPAPLCHRPVPPATHPPGPRLGSRRHRRRAHCGVPRGHPETKPRCVRAPGWGPALGSGEGAHIPRERILESGGWCEGFRGSGEIGRGRKHLSLCRARGILSPRTPKFIY